MLDQQRVNTMDIHMLVSIVNMQIRNDFSTLTELCQFYELDQQQLLQRMAAAGYQLQDQQQFTAA
ncbi:DUF4250 domain-containing protein [Agarivorans gilvus]|jgi:hypothetical protein|uniref:DUF4250 domain-containing protein n=1 Tax=Agarivorans gilvus TaxID=680279 RepID=A0ABQ1I2C7_9ALTE|nr:DUF4250 domain-containing protein [Agarivorans gilvus]GGB04841.1 hypothetical protein GCM10007414_17650 [Agarivorans gilvus]